MLQSHPQKQNVFAIRSMTANLSFPVKVTVSCSVGSEAADSVMCYNSFSFLCCYRLSVHNRIHVS